MNAYSRSNIAVADGYLKRAISHLEEVLDEGVTLAEVLTYVQRVRSCVECAQDSLNGAVEIESIYERAAE